MERVGESLRDDLGDRSAFEAEAVSGIALEQIAELPSVLDEKGFVEPVVGLDLFPDVFGDRFLRLEGAVGQRLDQEEGDREEHEEDEQSLQESAE